MSQDSVRREIIKFRQLQRQEEHRAKWAEQNGDDCTAADHQNKAERYGEYIEELKAGQRRVSVSRKRVR